MVAKNIFPFGAMIDGCKYINFMVISKEIIDIYKVSKTLAFKTPYSWENAIKFTSLQLSVTVAKANKSFAGLTHGWKAIIRHGLTFKNMNLSMNLE